MQYYRKLYVWQKAHALAVASCGVSARLSAPAAWPLRDQMLRAAISIPSNIAEGAGRSSAPDFRRFLFHSLGSCNELEYDLLLARDLGHVSDTTYLGIVAEVQQVRRMLIRLAQSISR